MFLFKLVSIFQIVICNYIIKCNLFIYLIIFSEILAISWLLIDMFLIKTNTAIYSHGLMICDRFSVIVHYLKGNFKYLFYYNS